MALKHAAVALMSVAIALGPLAGANHCEAWAQPEPEFQAAGIYIDNDLCQLECAFSLWIYQESNGIQGLQRGDEVIDDTCHGTWPADTLLVGDAVAP